MDTAGIRTTIHAIGNHTGTLPALSTAETIPITSPSAKNHSTCLPGRLGAVRAQTHAHRIETTKKIAVLRPSSHTGAVLMSAYSRGALRSR